jgi:hypothetical protein
MPEGGSRPRDRSKCLGALQHARGSGRAGCADCGPPRDARLARPARCHVLDAASPAVAVSAIHAREPRFRKSALPKTRGTRAIRSVYRSHIRSAASGATAPSSWTDVRNSSSFLQRKWNGELDYRLIKELWAFTENRIAVRFAYEWHYDSGSWSRINQRSTDQAVGSQVSLGSQRSAAGGTPLTFGSRALALRLTPGQYLPLSGRCQRPSELVLPLGGRCSVCDGGSRGVRPLRHAT